MAEIVTDAARTDTNRVPEQNKSVGESEPPLLLAEHIDENELESLGGSERRPSKTIIRHQIEQQRHGADAYLCSPTTDGRASRPFVTRRQWYSPLKQPH